MLVDLVMFAQNYDVCSPVLPPYSIVYLNFHLHSIVRLFMRCGLLSHLFYYEQPLAGWIVLRMNLTFLCFNIFEFKTW